MSRVLQLYHSISSFYLPFLSLRWLPHSVLQIGKNFNMFLTYFQAWFIFVYVKQHLFTYAFSNHFLAPTEFFANNFSFQPFCATISVTNTYVLTSNQFANQHLSQFVFFFFFQPFFFSQLFSTIFFHQFRQSLHFFLQPHVSAIYSPVQPPVFLFHIPTNLDCLFFNNRFANQQLPQPTNFIFH